MVTVTCQVYDGALSVVRSAADDIGVWLAIWQARDDGRPDAPARRCASDAGRRDRTRPSASCTACAPG